MRDHRIKQGDVWFLLRDFSLVLATIVASLTNFIRAENNVDDDTVGFDDSDGVNDRDTIPEMAEITNDAKRDTSRRKAAKAKVVESWEDEDDRDHDSSCVEGRVAHEKPNKSTATTFEPPIWEGEGRGLADVLEAFTLLKQDFDYKFHRVWA
ncbi:hypothetical protein RRF57_008797 [Xylaria bambusicola]|uniref:Uncharacterized protein n=1 Tax=Xylaria bambusicola TaxID=326684 RepID=A0AAN7ZBM4_9PEZI